MINDGLVVHKRIFYSRPGIYQLTKTGAKCTSLPPLDKIQIGAYEHQLNLIKIYIKLMNLYPEASWISERRLKHEKFYDGIGKFGHLADGILIFPENRKVAIEVELSLKSERRISQIFKSYAAQFDLKEVWYFCPKNILNVLKKLAGQQIFIKIFEIQSFCNE